MPIPKEFTQAYLDRNDGEKLGYGAFYTNGEPYRSLMRHNPAMRPPKPTDTLEWGAGRYYDTTVARKHDYWRHQDLPQPTKDLNQLRADFTRWGYGLIEDGVSPDQCQSLHERVIEQAAAERGLGLAHISPAQQHVWALVNKGDMFTQCMEHDPSAVQAGPLIERFMDEALGPGWNHYSFLANISFPGCHPQALHQDQSFPVPFRFLDAPALVNSIYILQDVNEVNGGTLVVPGSHQMKDGPEAYGPLPPPINLEAPAGTILLMDGRLLHAGAVNHSDRLRYILTNSIVKSWVRQQENFLLTVSPEVLAKASDKLLWRMGFNATSIANMVEGYGYFGDGTPGDPNGNIKAVRQRIDQGTYRRMAALTPDSAQDPALAGLGLAQIKDAHETHRGRRFQALLDTMQTAKR